MNLFNCYLIILLLKICLVISQVYLPQKSSLTFVIDDTSSMREEIDQVKKGADAIFQTVYKSNASRIENFILVTFNERDDEVSRPDFKVLVNTKVSAAFTKALLDIEIHGGGDCPEMAMSGIEEALKVSKPGSSLYVFTDAAAKDYEKFETIKTLSQRKQSQVVFVLTGRCGNRTSNDYMVYYKVAAATNGQVFNLQKNGVTDVLKYVEESAVSRRSPVVSKVFNPGEDYISVPINAKTTDVIFSLTGENAKINIYGPDGKEVNVEVVVAKEEIKIVKSKYDLTPGTYTAKVSTSSGGALMVTAMTIFEFQHGFSTFEPRTIDDTSMLPASDEKYYLSILPSRTSVNLESVDIVNNVDSSITIMNVPLHKHNNFYVTDLFSPPRETFKIAVNAIDINSKSPVRAMGITPIQRQNPRVIIATPPAVRIEEGAVVEVEYGTSETTLTCHATGYPEPTIQWKDEENNIIESSSLDSTLNSNIYKLTNVLKIKNSKENRKYLCTSTNKEGTITKMVQIKIKPYILIIDGPKDANVKYRSSHNFMCRIESKPASKIVWYHNNNPIVNEKEFKISPDNTSLTITSMEPNHVGKITCEANNGVETKNAHSNLTISGVEAPKINKSTSEVKTIADTDIELQCEITKGVPAPSVSWSYRQAPEEKAVFILADSDVFKIPQVKLSQGGQYICLATNGVGEDTHVIDVVVQSAPIILEDKDDHVIKVKYNTSIAISCKATGNPAPTITWKNEIGNQLNTKVLQGDSKHEYISELRMKNIIRDSNYYCEARNLLGKDEYNITVEIKRYTNMLKRPKNKMIVQVGSSDSLECEVEGSPPPVIHWLHNGEIITKENNLYELSENNTLLTIKNMGLSHLGTYVCEIYGYNQKLPERKLFKTKVSIKGIVRPKIDQYTPPNPIINSSMTIHCKILKGNPAPSITWYFQAHGSPKYTEIENHKEDKLTILNFDEINIGKYKCVAKNLGGEDVFQVDALIGVAPTVDDEPNPILVEDGKRVLLNCITKGYPDPSVRWVLNDKVLSGDKYTIFINNSLAFYANMEDSGTYLCVSSNKVGSATKTIDLKVVLAPEIEVPKKTYIEVMAGEPIMMMCQADGYPEPTITWTHRITERPGYSKNMETDDHGSSITIRSSVPEDSGIYTCVASNEYGSKALTYSVQVFVKPKIVSEKQTEYVAVTDDMVAIPCKAEGYPKPKISWTISGFKVMSDTEWNDILPDGTLVIKQSKPKYDNGNYICTAANKVGKDTYNVRVIIEEYPRDAGHIRKVLVSTGNDVNLNCDASRGSIHELQWYKDKKKFAKGELSLKSVTESDVGIYTCRSKSIDGTTHTSSIDLKLKDDLRPKFLRTHYVDEYIFKPRDRVEFDCEVTSDSNTKIIWKHNDKDLLHIKNYKYNFIMYPDNIGNYYCVVSNKHESIRRDFLIKREVCVATIPDLAHLPLILTSDWNNWSDVKPVNGTLTIPVGDSLHLSCPGIGNHFNLFRENTITAYCREGQKFQVEWIPREYTFADLQCAKPLQATSRDTGVRCSATATNTTLVKVGFDTVKYGFLDVYNVCFDKTKNLPVHIVVNVFSDNEDVVPIESTWTKPELIKADFDDMYNCAAQTERISTTLERHFDRDLCCFDKSMLVDPRDLEHRSAHIATYNYLNTAPQWGTCNKRKNWHDVEKRVRGLSRKLGHHLRVWTGTSETLTIRNKKINLSDSHEHAIEVPKTFWKVIQDPTTKASLAIIQPNIPDLDNSIANQYRRCKDICSEVDWMRGPDWQNVKLGFVYCCNINEFEKRFKYPKTMFNADGAVLNAY